MKEYKVKEVVDMRNQILADESYLRDSITNLGSAVFIGGLLLTLSSPIILGSIGNPAVPDVVAAIAKAVGMVGASAFVRPFVAWFRKHNNSQLFHKIMNEMDPEFRNAVYEEMRKYDEEHRYECL